MKRRLYFLLMMLLLFPSLTASQTLQEKELRGYTPPDELITLSANIPFNQALELISTISENKSGRKIVSSFERTEPIGVEIKNISYDKALIIIVQYANLIIETKDDLIVVKRKIDKAEDRTKENYAEVNSREVKISALFFEMNINDMREKGINWQFLLGQRGFQIGGGFTGTASQQNNATTSTDFALSAKSEFSSGGFFGEALSLFRYLESENLGEIISSPSVTVRNAVEGQIQVGSDFSFKTRDFSGNITENFFSTGSIIKVTPYIYEEEGVEYVLLKLMVERSAGFPSELSTEVRKTTANTEILMLNGEETVIAGLYLNEENTERVGIPFLKDLPWWVLGIRYLTGSDKVSIVKKELAIVIKVELLPTLKERLAFPEKDNLIKKEIDDKKKFIQFHQFDSTSTKKKEE